MDIRQLALLASRAEFHAKAVDLWSRYLADRADDSAARCNYAAALAATGKAEAAIAEYESLLVTSSLPLEQAVACRVNLSGLLIARGRPSEAAKHCEEALRLDETAAMASYNLNVSLRQAGERDRAVALSWTRLRRIAPLEFATRLTVVCVKWGTKYDARYVNRLYRGAKRHLSTPFDFVCITDDPTDLDDSVLVRPIPSTHLTTWWLKALLFHDPVARLRGDVLYLDLDTVIVGPLDDIVLRRPYYKLTILATDHIANENAVSEATTHPSCFGPRPTTRASTTSSPLPPPSKALTAVVYKFDHWLEMLFDDLVLLHADPDGPIVDYAAHVASQRHLASGDDAHRRRGHAGEEEAPARTASIVVFPLEPKPHDLVESRAWIRREWV